jgi:hypothetical protein
VRPRSSFSLPNSALRSRIVIMLPSNPDNAGQVPFLPRVPEGSLRERRPPRVD